MGNFTLQLRGQKRWRLKRGKSAHPLRGCTPHYKRGGGLLNMYLTLTIALTMTLTLTITLSLTLIGKGPVAAEAQIKSLSMADRNFVFEPPTEDEEEETVVILSAGWIHPILNLLLKHSGAYYQDQDLIFQKSNLPLFF